jgi:hypothetical protein
MANQEHHILKDNAHEFNEVVDIDDSIDYTMLNHDAHNDDDNNKGNTTHGDVLLAYMAGCSSLAGDIRKVIETSTKIPNKVKSGTGTSRKVNASKSTPRTIKVDDNTYYLYIGESIEVVGNTVKSGTGTSQSKSTPRSMQVDDSTFYLYKGESIDVDGLLDRTT